MAAVPSTPRNAFLFPRLLAAQALALIMRAGLGTPPPPSSFLAGGVRDAAALFRRHAGRADSAQSEHAPFGFRVVQFAPQRRGSPPPLIVERHINYALSLIGTHPRRPQLDDPPRRVRINVRVMADQDIQILPPGVVVGQGIGCCVATVAMSDQSV